MMLLAFAAVKLIYWIPAVICWSFIIRSWFAHRHHWALIDTLYVQDYLRRVFRRTIFGYYRTTYQCDSCFKTKRRYKVDD